MDTDIPSLSSISSISSGFLSYSLVFRNSETLQRMIMYTMTKGWNKAYEQEKRQIGRQAWKRFGKALVLYQWRIKVSNVRLHKEWQLKQEWLLNEMFGQRMKMIVLLRSHIETIQLEYRCHLQIEVDAYFIYLVWLPSYLKSTFWSLMLMIFNVNMHILFP